MKKILILIILSIGLTFCKNDYPITADQGATDGTTDRAISLVNVGTTANDHTGDPIRTAFQKVNIGLLQIDANTVSILLKVNISDTSAMLAHYINHDDYPFSYLDPTSSIQRQFNNIKNGIYNILDYGASPLGVIDATIAIQNACDAAYVANGKVIGSGIFKISNTITIRSDADFTGATFNLTDNTKTAVIWADVNNALIGKFIFFPKIVQLVDRTAGTWTGIDIGLKIQNGQANTFFVNTIENFHTGMVVTSIGAHGCVYNNFHLGLIEGCKVNLKLVPATPDGWVNDNNFIGGELGCWSSDGSGVSGTRALLIDTASVNQVNNNLFLKTGFEGDLFEYNMECYGSANTFLNCRWESSSPKANFNYFETIYATGNLIIGGYNANTLTVTSANNCDDNSLITSKRIQMTDRAAYTGSNPWGDDSPLFTVTPSNYGMGPAPYTAYGFGASYSYIIGKLTGDTYARWQVANGTGIMSWGPGNGAVDLNIQRGAAGVLKMTIPPTYADNTAALAGGLTSGMIYRTSAGILMIVY